jgi:uncharacterized protein YkwD
MPRIRIVIGALALLLSTTAACVAANQEELVGETGEELRNLDSEEAEFLRLLNQHRAANGLAPVVATPLLNQVAYDHSLDMATKGYFDHTNLEGQSPFDRMAAAGYPRTYMAENIAAGNAGAAATFEQWKNSPGHNTNMLSPNYKAVGIGRAYLSTARYRYYWTNVFGGVIDSSVTPGGTDAGAPEAAAPDASPPDASPPDASPPDAATPPVPTCSGAAEVEPNDDYRAPNAAGAATCGRIAAAGDADWYGFSVPSAGVAYDVRLERQGDADLAMWKIVSGGYSAIRATSATRIANTSSSAGSYIVRVRSPGGAAQPYRLTISK